MEKTTSIILVMALGLMMSPSVGEAVPMSTAFSYQGRLIDANSAADGPYDLQFRLYDDSSIADGNQVGETVDINDLDVIDGYFTVVLDFNDANALSGQACWLDISIRPGYSNNPDDYTTLSPRQEITPAPYAIYAKGVTAPLHLAASVPVGDAVISGTSTGVDSLTAYGVYGKNDSSGNYGVLGGNYTGTGGFSSGGSGVWGTSHSGYGVQGSSNDGRGVFGSAGNRGYAGYFEGGRNYFGGNVGIGITDPSEKLEVSGTVKATAFVGDGSGLMNVPTDTDWVEAAGNVYREPGRVGIGILDPAAKLHVVCGGSPAAAIGASATTATGAAAVALGSNADAVANYSIAMGTGTTSSGMYSTAIGTDITVSGKRSVGIGLGTSSADVNDDNVMAIMGGNVGIGTNNPQRTLHIKDLLRLEPYPGHGSEVFPPNPSDGDICVVGSFSNRHIFCYLGGNWRQLDN